MPKDLQIQPKVFGIGLSRTGTTSLTEALNQLGILTEHYVRDRVTQQELLSGSPLTMLEQYQGLVDGIAPFYQQLDRAHPESKFILTVREKQSWLQSMERLMSTVVDNWSWLDREAVQFSQTLYQLNYGSLQFDAQRHWQGYEQHQQAVRSYFRERPEDLLVINICGGEGWEKLCPFLELPIPSVPFPRSHDWQSMSAWSQKLKATWADLDRLIPTDSLFILVDECQLEPGDRLFLPFMEKQGAYWGPPTDDTTAIAELERMRRGGAKFMAFAWPAFWWLDHYDKFQEYLRSQFPCILENERLVIFELS